MKFTQSPKEDAINLWLTYFELLPDGVYSDAAAKEEAKKFALVAVNEMLTFLNKLIITVDSLAYQHLIQVKTELQNL